MLIKFFSMKNVLIAGGTGLVGTRLSQLLTEQGYQVAILSRRAQPNLPYRVFQWDVVNGQIDPEAVRFADYVINLAGAGIADKPWTDDRKKLIIDSRVDSTRLLLRAFQEHDAKPEAYLSSAAIGYYGDRADELLTEDAAPGDGFLSESCQAWEGAIQEVADAGIRTVSFRVGIVMSTQGGALEKMVIPFHFFLGTYFGDGQQWYSWVHIDDISRMFIAGIENPEMQGTYNGVAPNPERNKPLTRLLGQARGWPFLLVPAPAFILRLVLGEMADTILGSSRVSADKITAAGFQFLYPDLGEALRDLLQRKI
jgi:uncharacterized protein (TIGR01777 family)